MATRRIRRSARDTGRRPLEALLTNDDLRTSWRLALEAGGGVRPVSANTIALYGYALTHLERWATVEGIAQLAALTREQALRWVTALRAERAPKTARVYVTAARRFYQYLAAEGEIRADPFAAVRAPSVPERLVTPYTEAEIRRILRFQDRSTFLGLRNYALLLFLLDSGVRVSECAGIRTEEIDWKTGTVKVMGKGSRERIVRVGVRTRQALDKYLRARRRAGYDDPCLWVTRSGRPMSADRIRTMHFDQGRALGIHMHPHRARHTFAQSALALGMEREYAKYLLGHTSDAMLSRYTRASDSARAVEQHSRYSPMDRFKL